MQLGLFSDHGGIASRVNVRIRWVDSEEITDENVAEKLAGVDGILVPGDLGFHFVRDRIFTSTYQNVRLKSHALMFFDAGLCRLRLQFF